MNIKKIITLAAIIIMCFTHTNAMAQANPLDDILNNITPTQLVALEQNADKGDLKSQILLGRVYMQKDINKALKYLTMAANQGNKESQGMLGFLYFEGGNVQQDYYKAFHYFDLAAKQGVALAQFTLGLMHYRGMGCQKDDAAAFRLFKKAEAQKLPESYFTLGMMHFAGQGTNQDKIKGYAYINALDGVTTRYDTKGTLKMFEMQMTPSEIKEGKELSISFKQALN